MVKNFEDIFIRFAMIHERDGHRMPTYTALMHTHRAVKIDQNTTAYRIPGS